MMAASVRIPVKHPAIVAYYKKTAELAQQNVSHETATREAFKAMLERFGGMQHWTLVTEQRVDGLAHRAVPDATMRDANTLPRGYWEAKDTRDDLEAEIEKKFARGYPKTNIIFEDTRTAILYQGGERVGVYPLANPDQIAALFTRFLTYTEPNVEGFEQAVSMFKERTPKIAQGLLSLIQDAHKTNKAFQAAFATFFALCQSALNPNISRDAVDEMLIQHLLTERLMRTVFNNPDFSTRNAIAAEVETVIAALTSKSFSRTEFLGQLGFFYDAIEGAARDLHGFRERQAFINTVYERFFQGYAVKVADTHGIVYTPQPIVDFMCAAVEEVLHDDFGLALSDPQVCIIDPATGTGNFVINLLHRIAQQNPAVLKDVYQNRLFANEVMLLPYYVASLNIEHAYYELSGQYAPFEGLCFVDTLDLAEGAQMRMDFMTQKNSERVQRQKAAPITVIIGNPPYNVGQVNENDNNKNRKYDVIDKRIRETYAADSKASNKNALSDAYVKFFRWASDRLDGRDGIVCYVTNNGFVDGIAFDGMRKHLLQDFTQIYHLDLHGNARSSGEERRKEGGNVFNDLIRVGVGITVAVRRTAHAERKLFYHRVPDYWKADQKLTFLEQHVSSNGRQNALNTVAWHDMTPDTRGTWLVPQNADTFDAYMPMGSKETKSAKSADIKTLFKTFSSGVKTNRDEVVYDYDETKLKREIQVFIEDYNGEVDRYRRAGKPKEIDNFVHYERVKWSRDLKLDLVRGKYAVYDDAKVRTSLYRPFCKQHLFFDRVLNEEVYVQPQFFPTAAAESENRVIVTSDIGHRAPQFSVLMSSAIADLHLCAAIDAHQCFPFYVYDEDGTNRRDNITDWALAQFQTQYADPTITKWDIFYYTYGLLHQPAYRATYADNLKRDLPRLPFAPNFRAVSTAGAALADLHLNYETIAPYPLQYKWKPTGAGGSLWRVEKMKLTPDKTALIVNKFLTLEGIPPDAFTYRLGSRSALDWIIDQYQVKTDKRSGITSDPNRYSDDEKYIVELVGRVVAVSVKTVEIVAALGMVGRFT